MIPRTNTLQLGPQFKDDPLTLSENVFRKCNPDQFDALEKTPKKIRVDLDNQKSRVIFGLKMFHFRTTAFFLKKLPVAISSNQDEIIVFKSF